MKKLLLMAIAMLGMICPNFAQFTSVSYDMERNWFNEGQVLPAEKSMIVKGLAPDGVEMIEFNILSSKKSNHLFRASWKSQGNNEFSIPIGYKLRSSDEYDFRIDLFRAMSQKEQDRLKNHLTQAMDTYIDVNLLGNKSIKLLKKSGKTVKEMNSILTRELSRYRTKIADWDLSFSEIVRLKLEQLDKANLDKDYVKGDSTMTKQAVRDASRQLLIDELKAQVSREVNHMLDVELLELADSRTVDNYETEDKENGLSINVGYGGVYLSGNLDDFTYGSAPYLGLAFPLGNSVLGSKLLSNTSLTLGVFLENFEDENDNKVTGFLVDRPIYLGLDHKLFKFLRINAGAAFLEGVKEGVVIPDESQGKNIMVRPYIGISARIDLSIGLGK